MKLYIKYMVSLRCKLLVHNELEKLHLPHMPVELGSVELLKDISAEQRINLKAALLKSGLELMDDRRQILIEKIKNVVVEMIHYSNDLPIQNYSAYISEKLGQNYTHLAAIFSEVEGITLQQYIILHKIEKAKELLLYDELNLSQIADKLHYSSVAHLSAQFKKTTGLTPTFFKELKLARQNLEDI